MTREEAKREMLFAKREVMADSWIDKAYDVAISALEQPEIIHCRECKHWRSSDHTCHEHSLVSPMMANEFCSRAERREEGDE